MSKIVNSKIQIRRDTANNWSTNNPILAAGEIGFDLTNGKHKIGDGSNNWSSLPYFVLDNEIDVNKTLYGIVDDRGNLTYVAAGGSGYTATGNVSDLNNDVGYQTQSQVNALIAAAGADGQDGKSAYQYAVDGGYTGTEQEFAAKMAAEIPTKTSQLSNDSGYMTGLFLASYGHTSFADIKAAYLANKIVYCKASTGTDPGLGNQLRQAFLAYIGGSNTSPTSFEFQYYRSVTSHSNSQQGDQVFIYTIDSSSTWSVTTREAYTKIVAGTGLTSSYNNGTLTINLA